MDIDDFFSDSNIVRALCRLRAARARKHHDWHFLRNFAVIRPAPEHLDITTLFPSRSQLTRLRPHERQGRSTSDILAAEFERTVRNKLSAAVQRHESWALRLTEFVTRIRELALRDPNYAMRAPRIYLVKKNPHQPQSVDYRPIANYSLVDRIIEGLTAKYLRVALDPDFLPCSFAFRAAREGRVPTHHDAARQIVEYRERLDGDIWVAEKDIRSFYDCVEHNQARMAMQQACARATSRGVVISPRALFLFESYLKSYSFSVLARQHAVAHAKRTGKILSLPWPEGFVREYWGDLDSFVFGVPQGGAISCLLSNVLLDNADRAVLGSTPDPLLLYLRYCDDMVLMHPHRDSCVAAERRYSEALKELGLPAHPAGERPYRTSEGKNRGFWDGKSKAAYRWTRENDAMGVPWVSFVGYQVRHDGLLRVRKKSLAKELEKQAQFAGQILRLVRKSASLPAAAGGLRLSRKQILHRLRLRLIAMSVGRVSQTGATHATLTQCWAAGFSVLHGRQFVVSQLRRLDRGRERQLRRIARACRKVKVVNKNRRKLESRYWGFPYSYIGAFARKEKP